MKRTGQELLTGQPLRQDRLAAVPAASQQDDEHAARLQELRHQDAAARLQQRLAKPGRIFG